VEEGTMVRMRPFALGKKMWEKAMVTKNPFMNDLMKLKLRLEHIDGRGQS